MKLFPLEISSPDGTLFSGDVQKISVRGVEGELAVMAGHVPFVTSVVESEFHIDLESGDVRFGHTPGGILTVSADSVIFLTGNVDWQE